MSDPPRLFTPPAHLEDLLRDIRHATRGLARTRGFAIAVVLTLALGIGANTAIFSVVDQVLLRPLPYSNGDELVTVYEAGRSSPGHFSVSPANWLDWQRQSRTFSGFAAWRTTAFTLTGVGEPLRVNGQLISAEFFPLLGVSPLLGRTMSQQDDRPNAPSVAILSYELWQRRFAGEPNTIGRTVQLNDRPVEIIGIMPAGFRFMYQDNDVWSASQLDRHENWRQTSGRFIRVVGRIKRGTTMASARSEMQTIAERLAATYEFNRNTTVDLVPLREELTGQVQSSIVVLYGAVAVLLLIACVNVANLLVARSASRRRELAIRTSLGAGRLAIVRQLLVESSLLAIAGGAVGVALARMSIRALLAFSPPDLLRVATLTVDRRVLLYATALSVLTGIVVGLVPAMVDARRSIVSSLRAGGSSVTAAPRVRQILVVCQMAMTVVLLCGAGLLVRTVIALNRVNAGFEQHGLLTMNVVLPATRYTPERRVAFFRDAAAALRALPGVESAAAANSLAVIGSPRGGTTFHRIGMPELPMNDRPSAAIRVVTPGYFHTLGIPVLRGREFTTADDANPAAGFIVNEAFAKTFLSDVDPLTTAISVWMERENPHLPIIGVVGSVSEGSVRDEPRPTVFYSHRRMQETGMTLFARTGHPETLTNAAVNAIHAIDRNLAVTRVRTFDSAMAESLARERLNALVSGSFAVSGLLLASLGLYGLLAYLVAERMKEIGIRIALGAHIGKLTGSVIAGGLRLVGVGAAIGLVMSLVLLRSFGTLLFGVTPYDAWTYVAVLALLGAVAAAASYVPARRAGRIEPLVALRQE
jgi:putative ABC transport system permease protein